MDYLTKNHTKFLILYHLIFVCKYRKKLLIPYGDETKKIFEDIATRSDFSFEAIEVDQDHIHCLVKSEPGMSPLAVVRRLKQESTIQLWQRHEKELKKHFWKERTFWSDGYFCCTIGNASQETIKKYIESQG
jgi:putative transposase